MMMRSSIRPQRKPLEDANLGPEGEIRTMEQQVASMGRTPNGEVVRSSGAHKQTKM